MQKIERYGVIALVFLLVTILAVSLWGESKDGGLFFWKKDGAGADKQAQADRPRPRLNANAELAAQGPRAGGAGGLELSPVDNDPLAAQAREQRLAQMQRRAEFQAAAQAAAQNAAQNPVQHPAATPGDALAPGQGQFQAQPGQQPLGGATLAQNQPFPVQSGVVAVPVGQSTLVRPALTPAERPSSGAARSYTVKSGDTLGEIARRELGASARWTEIQKLNGNLDPTRVRTGMVLLLPASGAPTAAVAANTATRTAGGASRNYTIRSGDTLSAVAARELGSAERWAEIAALNPRVDPSRLAVGAVIALPASGATQVATARPAAVDERRAVAAGPGRVTKSKVQ